MRKFIVAVCFLLTAQCIQAQNFVHPHSEYTVSYAHRHRRHLEPLMLAGGITTSLGGIVTGVGFFYYTTAFDTYDGTAPVNKLRENLGTGIMIAGGLVTVAGLVMLIAGKNKSMHAYTWEPIAPKMNEVGLAYNFK